MWELHVHRQRTSSRICTACAPFSPDIGNDRDVLSEAVEIVSLKSDACLVTFVFSSQTLHLIFSKNFPASLSSVLFALCRRLKGH